MTRTAGASGRRLFAATRFGLVLCSIAVLGGCSSEATGAAVVSPTTVPAVAAPTATPAVPTPMPTVPPAPTAGVEPLDGQPVDVPVETEVDPLPGVRAIGDLAAAPAGTFVTVRPGAGMPHQLGGNVVPVYDVPGGEPRVLQDRNDLDGVILSFPLLNPTVFDQPLVLRVIAGAPEDEWLLVQAPIRPHRQYIWVRSEDFVYDQTDLRIEVDLGRDGRLALFDGNQEVITSIAVYGRESRPTVLHDTYVEQAFDASVLSPAYGTYILTMAGYSESLGTFGGGGLPGQSIHGTNQPELIGQRVSSGGIRVPNEIIEFIYQQPGLLGASVLIYDSTGIGRDGAIALQRNKPWSPALTTAMDDGFLEDGVPVASYS